MKSESTIYELTDNLLTLMDMAEDPDIEPDVLKDTMEAVEGEFEIKAEGYAKVITELNGRVKMLAEEEKRIAARRKAVENNIDRMKKVLEEAMIATGKTKFKTDLFSFGIQKNPASVHILDVNINDVPAEYVTFAEPTFNKKAIGEALKAGQQLDFAELVQTESLRIR